MFYETFIYKKNYREMFLYLSKKILKEPYANKVVYNFSKNLYSLKELPFTDYV